MGLGSSAELREQDARIEEAAARNGLSRAESSPKAGELIPITVQASPYTTTPSL